MIKNFIFIAAVLLSFSAFAQQPVQQPILSLLNDVVALPTSGQVAAQKCTNANGNCDGGMVAGQMTKRIGSLQIDMTSTSGIPDSSTVTKLQQMTPAQQQAWAMQYAAKQQAGMTAQAHVPTKEELAVTQSQQDLQGRATAIEDSIGLPWMRLEEKYDSQFEALGKKRSDELDKCPLDPKVNMPTTGCFNSIQEEYQAGVAALMKNFLKEAQAYLDNAKNNIRAQYATADNQLAAANYMTASPAAYQKVGAMLQTDMLLAIAAYNDCVGKAWEKCCTWQHDIDQSKKMELGK